MQYPGYATRPNHSSSPALKEVAAFSSVTLMTYYPLTYHVTMSRDDGGVILPRPYGEAFDDDDGLEDLIANRLDRMERSRRFWGRLSNTWLFTLVRNILPTLAIFTSVAVMAIPGRFDPSLAAFISGATIFIFIGPSVISSNYSLWVGLDRLGAVS